MDGGAGPAANSGPFPGARGCRPAGDCALIVFGFRRCLARVFDWSLEPLAAGQEYIRQE
jgi:hypothetical protein